LLAQQLTFKHVCKLFEESLGINIVPLLKCPVFCIPTVQTIIQPLMVSYQICFMLHQPKNIVSLGEDSPTLKQSFTANFPMKRYASRESCDSKAW
jgi:hypothetical protein